MEIPASAILNTGLKNIKWSTPQKGIHSGKWLFIKGKYNISKLEQRYNNAALPKYEIIDLLKQGKAFSRIKNIFLETKKIVDWNQKFF